MVQVSIATLGPIKNREWFMFVLEDVKVGDNTVILSTYVLNGFMEDFKVNYCV